MTTGCRGWRTKMCCEISVRLLIIAGVYKRSDRHVGRTSCVISFYRLICFDWQPAAQFLRRWALLHMPAVYSIDRPDPSERKSFLRMTALTFLLNLCSINLTRS